MLNRILFVDPDELLERTFRKMMHKLGWQSHTAVHCGEALLLAGAETFDCILFEMSLPHHHLRKLMTSVRDYARLKQVRSPVCLAVTGNYFKRAEEDCRLLGADGLLWKPFGIEDLLKAHFDAVLRMESGPVHSEALRTQTIFQVPGRGPGIVYESSVEKS